MIEGVNEFKWGDRRIIHQWCIFWGTVLYKNKGCVSQKFLFCIEYNEIRPFQLIFYSVMFLENSLLIGVWAVGVNGNELHSANNTRPATTIFTLLSLFCGGLFFMGLYYR